MTFYFQECIFRGLINRQTSVFQTKRIQLLSKLYQLGNLCCLWVFQELLRVWVLLILYHHPRVTQLFTESAWHVAQLSSKIDLPCEASPSGMVTSGYLIYFFFFPPININKNKYVEYSIFQYSFIILKCLTQIAFQNRIFFVMRFQDYLLNLFVIRLSLFFIIKCKNHSVNYFELKMLELQDNIQFNIFSYSQKDFNPSVYNQQIVNIYIQQMEKTSQKQYFLILNNSLPQKFHRKTNRSSSKSLQSHTLDDQLKNFYVKNIKNKIKPETSKQSDNNTQKILKKKIILGLSRCQSPSKQLQGLESQQKISVTRKNNLIQNNLLTIQVVKQFSDKTCQINFVQKLQQDYCILIQLNKQLQNQIKTLKLQLQIKDQKILQLQKNNKQLSLKLQKSAQCNIPNFCGQNTISTASSFGLSSHASFFYQDSEIVGNPFVFDFNKNQQNLFAFRQQIKTLKIQLQFQKRKSHLSAEMMRDKKDKQIKCLKKKYYDFLSKYKQQMKKTFSEWVSNNSIRNQMSIQLQYSSEESDDEREQIS